MIPVVKNKLIEAVEDLELFVEENEEDEQLKDTEQLENARNQIESSHGFIEMINNEEEAEENEDNKKEEEGEEEEVDEL